MKYVHVKTFCTDSTSQELAFLRFLPDAGTRSKNVDQVDSVVRLFSGTIDQDTVHEYELI